ncbi:SDR family oxidoreductase [Roseomonas frigidaquae]|uniref:SDR family oxidoreductase n=1 Tax=Falsiroseomonas frigidaquae TaxID=487318 RepID=A0ABX1EZ71_9PROT|nr:SDR family NAD(P)-dependent oxidoreductase [Falsiroseomonas frigidaquae]NKE45381.1 SDR family oxidoreductase [Falsiroseomonas frigidaquae]
MPTENKVALVTGGARGIGRGCVHALAERGYDIVIVDLLRAEMERTQAEVEAMGRQVMIAEADVADHARAREIAAEVRSRFGRIDVLVNNAGRGNPTGILDITEEAFDRTIAVNLKSCFNYIQALVPLMQEGGGGRIVSMSSLNAHTGGVTSAVSKFSYAAAKAGIIGMTKALAKELGPEIAINCVCPGVIETEVGNSLTKARGPELAKKIMLGRLGTPADVAQLVAFLATAEPFFITGQAITIDGFQWEI